MRACLKPQIPSTKFQAPNSKHQIPNKQQIRNPKDQNQICGPATLRIHTAGCFGPSNLGFRICLVLGFWNLGFCSGWLPFWLRPLGRFRLKAIAPQFGRPALHPDSPQIPPLLIRRMPFVWYPEQPLGVPYWSGHARTLCAGRFSWVIKAIRRRRVTGSGSI